MSVDGWNTVLVLGGIRSGKSEFAESLVGGRRVVRYVATAAGDDGAPGRDASVAARHARRPETWTTEELASQPARLVEVITGAGPDETLLVDDLGGWVAALLGPAYQPADIPDTVGELASAIRDCPARLVVVSPEVGLAPVPPTPAGRAFADALGAANQEVAQACDGVVLVVAGQPTWLKPPPARTATAPAIPAQAHSVPAAQTAASVATSGTGPLPETPTPPPVLTPTAPTPTAPAPALGAPAAGGAAGGVEDSTTGAGLAAPSEATSQDIEPGMSLPLPDEVAGPRARERLAMLDVPGTGPGNLGRVVEFAAATQGREVPADWRSVRVLLLHGDHRGGVAAGVPAGESRRRADQARRGEGPLAGLAATAGATLQVVEAPVADPIETGAALSGEAVESALRYGWRLADEAVDSGVDVIVLAACGTGSDAAAAAVIAATAGAEPVAVLPRVVAPGGLVDDAAWMVRCAAVRDALHRVRRTVFAAKDVLAHLGGGDIAVATGVLLGAAARRTPVLLDGPVGVAAGLVSRDLAGQARHWCLLPDHGGHPAVRFAADVLGLTPLLDLRMDLGEGATSLATLPLLRSALTLAGTLPTHPALAAGTPGPDEGTPQAAEPDEREFAEPEPAGPGPAAPAEETPDEQVFDQPPLPTSPQERPDPYWPVEERPTGEPGDDDTPTAAPNGANGTPAGDGTQTSDGTPAGDRATAPRGS